MTKRLLLLAMSLLTVPAAAQMVDTRAIDLVRNKEVLDSRDMKVIEDFVRQAIAELVNEKDFTSISKTRAIILSRSQSAVFPEGGQAQYNARFIESANTYIGQALQSADSIVPQQQGALVVANLLILTGELGKPQLAGLALSRFDDPRAAIRYLAVLAVTNEAFRANLKETQLKEVADRITEKLNTVVEKNSPEILSLAAEFAAAMQSSGGDQLLLKIADKRIAQYMKWKVECELLDARILQLLCDTLATPGSDKADIAQRFSQLFSCVIQRYIEGQNVLNAEQKQQLVSVMAETENSCMEKMTGRQQSIRAAIEQDDMKALKSEHDRLLGTEAKPGVLAAKYKFDYGQSDNEKRTAPLVLPPPVSQVAENG
jgi:hypothetical protein